jgi:hypothetical protein
MKQEYKIFAGMKGGEKKTEWAPPREGVARQEQLAPRKLVQDAKTPVLVWLRSTGNTCDCKT